MKKIIVRTLRLSELLILATFIIFFLLKIFSPADLSYRKYPCRFDIASRKIVFEAILNNNLRASLTLISLDTRAWSRSLGIWDSGVFQKALDSSSLFLSGLDLGVFREWIINNNIDYYSRPFPGRIYFVFEKEGRNEIDYRNLVKNYKNLSLENIIFIGLGLDSFLQTNQPQDKEFIEPHTFLKSYFHGEPPGIILNKDILPEDRVKVKVIISLQKLASHRALAVDKD